MNELRLWVISLISVTIICALIEKFAPDGGLNKYVRLACGLAVTVTIAGPIIRFLGGSFNIQDIVWKDYVNVSEGEMKSRVARLEEEDSKRFLEVYRQTIVSDIKTRCAGESGFTVSEVDAVLQEDYHSPDYGAIRELYIKVSPPSGNPDADFSPETEKKLSDEISQAFGVDGKRIIIDSSIFWGR